MFFGKRFSGYHRDRLSGLDILVLSIIKNNDGISGYDLIQKINKKFKDLWKASAGTIYPLLSRLTEKAFISVEEIVENNRQKKIYRIMQTGNSALKKVLESNLEPSINCLGDYIRTIIKASVPSEKTIQRMMHCFPFPGIPFAEEVDETDYGRDNINSIKRTVSHLKLARRRMKDRISNINEKIERFSKILEKIEIERNKNAKPIEIVDNDEDFENF